MANSSDEHPVQVDRLERDNGCVRWWRPDIAYRGARSGDKSRRFSVALALILIVAGPIINSFQKHGKEVEQQAKASMAAKRAKVKREEKWRMEAREEYRNDR